MNFHEYANIFPMMGADEYTRLRTDISENGLIEPIWIYDNKILDGRNRYKACSDLELKPEFREYLGSDPLSFVISLNLARRHLNESQRAMVAANIADLPQGNSVNRKFAGLNTQSEAGNMLNVSERSVNTAKKVQREGSEELIEAVQGGQVSVSAAADISILPKEEQSEIVARGEKEILEAAKVIRAEKSKAKIEHRKQNIQKQVDEIEKSDLLVSERKFHVISIDPPWPYDDCQETTFNPNGRRVANPYPEISIEQITKLEIPAEDDSVMWLWTTHKFLPNSFDLLKEWGREV